MVRKDSSIDILTILLVLRVILSLVPAFYIDKMPDFLWKFRNINFVCDCLFYC